MIFKNKKLKKCERKLLIILALATTYCYGDLEAKDKKMSTEPDKETLEFLVGFYEEFDGMDDE